MLNSNAILSINMADRLIKYSFSKLSIPGDLFLFSILIHDIISSFDMGLFSSGNIGSEHRSHIGQQTTQYRHSHLYVRLLDF